jgi:uncharacterized membrane protein
MLVVFVCLVVSYTDLVLGKVQIEFLQMPSAVIGIFFFLVILNVQIRKLGLAISLRLAELVIILYVAGLTSKA